jgi:hypothetical protein
MSDIPQYADFTWPSRWNKGEVVASLLQSGPEVMAVNFMGTLRFRLDDTESVAAIVNSARRFADAVERTKRAFDGLCTACGTAPVTRWTSEITGRAGWDPEGLCRGCFNLRAAEAAGMFDDDLPALWRPTSSGAGPGRSAR